VQLTIRGHDPPGRTFCGPDGSLLGNVHVGVQVRRDPWALVPGDADRPEWLLDIGVTTDDGGRLDFAGPAVQGRRGERFVYLTWGDVAIDGTFTMFRRAKLMLSQLETAATVAAVAAGDLDHHVAAADVQLSDRFGHPRCARVDPPAVTWSLSERR
jgi:hypothetical protein